MVQIVIALIITPDALPISYEATGLSSRSVLERMSEIQMLDMTIPATDGREVRMKRYSKPQKVHQVERI